MGATRLEGGRTRAVQEITPSAENTDVAKSRRSSPPKFGATSVSAASQFTRGTRSGVAYDYWAPGSAPTRTGRRWGQRSTPLADDVLAPLGEPPRYYALGWQIVLWLAFAALALMLAFG